MIRTSFEDGDSAWSFFVSITASANQNELNGLMYRLGFLKVEAYEDFICTHKDLHRFSHVMNQSIIQMHWWM